MAEMADFNGDGNSDILWQNDSGLQVIWSNPAVWGGVVVKYDAGAPLLGSGNGRGWNCICQRVYAALSQGG